MEKENKKILVGIIVPVLVITGLILFSQVNLDKEQPQYDFLYFIDGNNSYYWASNSDDGKKYEILGGQMEIYDDSIVNEIRLYDVSENSYRRVSKTEIESFDLETQSVSRDGFSLEYGTRANMDFFLIPVPNVRNDYSTMYLVKEGTDIKLNLGGSNYYNQRDMFIGWIEN